MAAGEDSDRSAAAVSGQKPLHPPHAHLVCGHEEERCSCWWAMERHSAPAPHVSKFCSSVWALWLLTLVGGCYLLLDVSAPLYATFVTLTFFSTKFIPDPGDCPWPYFLHLCLPFIAHKGLKEGGAWTFSTFYWAFVMLPILDPLVGVDTNNKTKSEYRELSSNWGFRLSTFLFVPAQLALISYGCFEMNSGRSFTAVEMAGFITSVGVYTGGMGICISHELVHRATKLEQWLGRSICATICYGHFYVEHNRGHHKLVGTEQDPASARYGESFYSFMPRVVLGSFVSAWKLEFERLQRNGLPLFHNEMIWYTTFSALLCYSLSLMFGPESVKLFLGQSAVGILLFESVNYLEHFGLEREDLGNGKHEPVGYEHSWDSPHRLTNMVLFKLQRHADHHVNAGKRFQVLRATVTSPQLPVGYPTCILLSMVPPLWWAIMHPRIDKVRQAISVSQTHRKWRHGPHPAPMRVRKEE